MKLYKKEIKTEDTLEGFYNYMPNNDYHADVTHFSSSTLKMILKKPEEFYTKYIKKEKVEQEENTNFIFGSYVHSLILEPHLTDDEFAVYPGKVRRGEKYAEFVEANPGKEIVTQAEVDKAKLMMLDYERDPFASKLISDGQAEQSLFTELDGVPIKVRSDYNFVDQYSGYIADVKTTGGAVDRKSLMRTIGNFDYDLSAALYVDAFSKQLGMPFNFFFIFISKNVNSDEPLCRVVKASEQMLVNGRKKVKKALDLYKERKESGIWIPEDAVAEIDDYYPGGEISEVFLFKSDLFHDEEADDAELKELENDTK